MFKAIGKMLANIARAMAVAVKATVGVFSKDGDSKSLSEMWHSTLRSKNYKAPHEMTEEEVAQAQNDIRKQPVDMSTVQVQSQPATNEPVRHQTPSGNAPTMSM